MPSLLIVEDDDAIQFALEQLFLAEGYAVHVASELRTARRVLAAHQIDAVLLDMRLADGDYGGDLVVELADRTDTPAVAILSASPELAVPLAKQYGITWIPKPFDCEIVLRVVSIARDMQLRPRRTRTESARVVGRNLHRRAG